MKSVCFEICAYIQYWTNTSSFLCPLSITRTRIYQTSWHNATYDTVGTFLYFLFQVLIICFMMGLWAYSIMLTRKAYRILNADVQFYFFHPSRLAVAPGQASEKASASKSFHCPAREVPLSRFIQPAHQLNKSSCTKCKTNVLGIFENDDQDQIL